MFKKTDDVRCENCVFWETGNQADGFCRRFPPSGSRGPDCVTIPILTYAACWCGEFQHREQQASNEPSMLFVHPEDKEKAEAILRATKKFPQSTNSPADS